MIPKTVTVAMDGIIPGGDCREKWNGWYDRLRQEMEMEAERGSAD